MKGIKKFFIFRKIFLNSLDLIKPKKNKKIKDQNIFDKLYKLEMKELE